MIQLLAIRIVKRIPTIKDLVKRLKYNLIFRLECLRLGTLFCIDLYESDAYHR